MQASTFVISPRPRAPVGGLFVEDRQYPGGVLLPDSARTALEAVAKVASHVALVEPVVIGIAGFAYRLDPIAIAPSVGSVAYSLHDTARNRLHHVHRDNSGEVVCDCPDFAFRRQGSGQTCKHGRRLLELGLIPTTTPRVLPTVLANDGGDLISHGRERNVVALVGRFGSVLGG